LGLHYQLWELKREVLARELLEIEGLTSENPKHNHQDEDSDIMSERSGGSDSDPAEDTLPNNEFENLLSE